MTSTNSNCAVFLDRDGVLIEEVHLLTTPEQIQIPGNVPDALRQLKDAGFQLIVISNQTVISRGLISEDELAALNQEIENQLRQRGAPPLDGWYICPHHPKATVPAYRLNCDCRKPKPGMLFQAAREHSLDLSASFMIGDRITDIIAGSRAGCRTVMVATGAHLESPIETSEPIDLNIKPDFSCGTLMDAANWILKLR